MTRLLRERGARRRGTALATVLLVAGVAGAGHAQTPARPPAPQFAQPGKDVVWVPSPTETIALMLDLARVSADDYVIDLGSGDGRTVIAAAQRGARALGVEYTPALVTHARAEALRAGVADRARFVEGDMYEADVSKADVLALFLLTENLRRLAPTFLQLRPGTRIVSNTFTIPGWTPEATARRPDPCTAWCTVLLYLVPAQVGGLWQSASGTLRLVQHAQEVQGTWTGPAGEVPLRDAALRGDRLSFRMGAVRIDARVAGAGLQGTAHREGQPPADWTATRQP